MLKNSLIVTGLSIVTRALGFLVTLIIANQYGVTSVTDAYYIANTLPTLIVTILVASLTSALVPSFAKWLVSGDHLEKRLFGAYITVSLGLSFVITLILEILAPSLMNLLYRSVPTETLSLSLSLVQLLLLIIPFSVLIGAFSAALNAQQRFTTPALAPGLDALVSIIVILLGYKSFGIFSVAYGMISGKFISALWLAAMVARSGVRITLTFRIPGDVWRDLRLSLPLVVGSLAIQLNPTIDRIMAALLSGAGNVATLDFADRILLIPMSLLYSGFLVVSLSHWSESIAKNQRQALQASVQNSLIGIVFVMAPFSLSLFAMRQPVVQLLYEHGAIGVQAAEAIANVIGILSLGLLPYCIGLIFSRLILAYRRPSVLMMVGLCNSVLNAALNLLFMQPFGLNGIALSTSITYTLTCCILILYCLFTRLVDIDLSLVSKLGKILLAALALIAFVQFPMRLLANAQPVVVIGVTTIVGGTAYGLAVYLQHLGEIDVILARMWTWCRRVMRLGIRVR